MSWITLSLQRHFTMTTTQTLHCLDRTRTYLGLKTGWVTLCEKLTSVSFSLICFFSFPCCSFISVMRCVYVNMKLHYIVPNHRKHTDSICVGARRKTKEPPAIVGKLKLTACWPGSCRSGSMADLQTWPGSSLSQVHICLCSLGNYGKYYCSLLPLTELGALTRGNEVTRGETEFSAAPGDFCPAVVVIKKKGKYVRRTTAVQLVYVVSSKTFENSLTWSPLFDIFSFGFLQWSFRLPTYSGKLTKKRSNVLYCWLSFTHCPHVFTDNTKQDIKTEGQTTVETLQLNTLTKVFCLVSRQKIYHRSSLAMYCIVLA